MKKYIPNILSLIRLLLVPWFIIVYFRVSTFAALIIYIAASLLDVLDGFLARKWNVISNLGKILDPVGDKALQLSVLITFTVDGVLPWLIPAVLGAKELTMLVGGLLISHKRKNIVYSNLFGKIASASLYISIGMMFLHDYLPVPLIYVLYILLYMCIVFSVAAMVQYGILMLFIKPKKEAVPVTDKKEENNEPINDSVQAT